MDPDQTPPPAARAALESLYYDQATELCDLCPLAESGDDRMHGMHLAILEALADAHEAGRADALTAGPTIGGPMPEPWPGMGVEWVREDGSRAMFVADPVQDGDTWYFLAAAEPEILPADSIVAADIVAIYDRRLRIWKRNP